MSGDKKAKAAKNMINNLYECGYIDERYKETLEYRLKTGDLKVFEEIRAYLIALTDEMTS